MDSTGPAGREPTGRAAPGRAPSRTKGWVIGRVAGAPVILTRSWFLAAAILTLLFAPTVQRAAPQLGGGIYVVAFAFVLLLFGSVFLHEVAHALVARARGHEVTELAVTLWGGHTAYAGSSRRPLDGVLISVVGPLTNLLLGGAFWLAFQAQAVLGVPALLLYAAAFANVFVGVFNLLPGLPLDGGQILESVVWAATGSRTRGTIAAGWVGRAVAVGIVVWALTWPLSRGAQPDLFTVAWAALIGAFLWSGAGSAMRAGRAREAVAAISVRALAQPVVTVHPGSAVADAVRALAAAPGARALVLDPAGTPVAYVDDAAARSVPEADATRTPVSAVSVGLPPAARVDIEASGADLVDHLAATARSTSLVVVTDAGRVVGALDVTRVIAALQSARGGSRPARP
ncbi:site-2 protease family protein [Oerskovia flava]|uniref:site-2 protease family protein n=1 Tax=Oerskovia flava TaxID=2986422 RepID=UPI00223E9531|nr:site-2 protease family protein [Oerskovia sp. JB1-3-2]